MVAPGGPKHALLPYPTSCGALAGLGGLSFFPASFTMSWAPQAVTQFLVEAHHITTEATFIINSLPNAELLAVERIVHQLDATREILLHLEDPYSLPEELEELVAHVDGLLIPLEEYLASPPPPPNANVPRNPPTGSRGRPRFALDVYRAKQLHDLGLAWKDISSAMGVSRKTLYNHLLAAGLSTARPMYSDITDDDLDDVVQEICTSHPFTGSAVVHGHLETRGIHVQRSRVQASLRRVDPFGVLIRYVATTSTPSTSDRRIVLLSFTVY